MDSQSASNERPASDFADGAAYVRGRFTPLSEASVPLADWGYRRSDVTYDVVSVWDGAFFRLEDHLERFQASMRALRLQPREGMDEIRRILARCVQLLGRREAYVAMDCLRGTPRPGAPRHPAYCQNHFAAFAVPWVWVMPPDVQQRGAHLIIARTPRIGDASVDPRIKNFHWGDLTQALFEAGDRGADNAVLLDADGHLTEGPGFNVFVVKEGVVLSPDRGALDGVTRKSVFELCAELSIPFEIRPITGAEVQDADEIFLTTTAGGIMPASRIEGRILGNDRPGVISEKLRETFWRRRAEGWHSTPVDSVI